jgi:hypothetical protein
LPAKTFLSPGFHFPTKLSAQEHLPRNSLREIKILRGFKSTANNGAHSLPRQFSNEIRASLSRLLNFYIAALALRRMA